MFKSTCFTKSPQNNLVKISLLFSITMSFGILVSCESQSSDESTTEEFQDRNITRLGLIGTKRVAFSFDDGPSRDTSRLLDILREENVPATFFVLGDAANSRSSVLERMRDEGHVVANHTRTHDSLRNASPQKASREIGYTHEIIKDYNFGHRFYFRAPYGAWSSRHVSRLNSNPTLKQYIGPIFWDIGGETKFNSAGNIISAADWECWGQRRSVDTCLRGYHKEITRRQGGVILMHDLKSGTVDMVERLIPMLKDEGYIFLSLDDVSSLDQYEAD